MTSFLVVVVYSLTYKYPILIRSIMCVHRKMLLLMLANGFVR